MAEKNTLIKQTTKRKPFSVKTWTRIFVGVLGVMLVSLVLVLYVFWALTSALR